MVGDDRRHVSKEFSVENDISDIENDISDIKNDIYDNNINIFDNDVNDNSREDLLEYIDNIVVMKMDSAASRNMSGCPNRIVRELRLDTTVNIIGFDGSRTQPSRVGLNRDGKLEYYVPDMPSVLALLCAYEYAKDGAVVLLPDGGVCLKLNADELKK